MATSRFSAKPWRRVHSFAVLRPLCDTYHHLLENPAARHLGRCAEELPHDTPTFSKRIYENSRGRRFFSRRDAYRDWLTVGRPLGLTFSEGMNTLLKVVLKVKDEAYLLPKWMDYYAELVGWHNIVIMDCGSTDEEYLSLLQSFSDRVLIFSYPHYYDNIHNVDFNRDFYRLIARNCRYLCVVDADEFVFGLSGDRIGRDTVAGILSGGHPIYPGTWYPNVVAPAGRDGSWREPLRFGIAQKLIAAGTFSGKAIVRSDLCGLIGHVGHNLHVPEVAARIEPEACGRIGILHVSNLGPERVRARALMHLRSKGIVPADMPRESVGAFLEEAIARGTLEGAGLRYARQALQPVEEGVEEGPTFETNLITGPGTEPNPEFRRHVEAFDFSVLLRR